MCDLAELLDSSVGRAHLPRTQNITEKAAQITVLGVANLVHVAERACTCTCN